MFQRASSLRNVFGGGATAQECATFSALHIRTSASAPSRELTLQIDFVTTSDQSLVRAVRATIHAAREVFLCVAFVHRRGLHLLERELEELRNRGVRPRLLVTTTFQMSDDTALDMAHSLGFDIRILNPRAGRSFHPKVYLGATADHAQAIVGSANLTGGLATNYEAAVFLRGARDESKIARAWQWAEELWDDDRADRWRPRGSAAQEEEFEPSVHLALKLEVGADPVFRTLGAAPRENRIVDLTSTGAYVETERSRALTGGPAFVPAWMFNLAWDRLRTHGRLTNQELLREMRVHRSSAVCAILARLPTFERLPGPEIELGWR